ERDGVEVDTDSAKTWARRLLEKLEEKARPSWGPWDYAAAGEAYLALGERDDAADSFAHYWNMQNADPFALAGTERQLREIWRITKDSDDPFLSSLLVHIEARKLAAPGGGGLYLAADLVNLAARVQAVSATAEATFGAGSAIPLGKVLGILDRARSICRITDSLNSNRSGTGFLVKGRDVGAGLEERVLVLTNHHVLHGAEASESLLEGPDYQGSIPVERALAEFHYWEGRDETRKVKLAGVVCSSPRAEADFTLATLAEDVRLDRALPVSRSLKPLGSRNVIDPRQRAKVFVVGHPGGGDLSFSLSDNEVVDHELDDGPSIPRPARRIHYRTPTERGSSGSPVLHHDTLEVVGLHRSGGVKPLRSDWPRARADERYEANEAVSIRSIRELLG
ncbi:MAG: trypsin-like serine peptidase, partial [Vicinamibacteria bacterium]